MSDMSRLETKMERLSDQLSIKEREMQTMASKVTKPKGHPTSCELLFEEAGRLLLKDSHDCLYIKLNICMI